MLSSQAARHTYLKQQISMRVIGLGMSEYKTAWTVGGAQRSDAELLKVLSDLLQAVGQMRVLGKLPEEAVAPSMKPKSFKQLGTPTAEAAELEQQEIIDLESLKAKAIQRRVELERNGFIDTVQENMPKAPPRLNTKGASAAQLYARRAQPRGPLALHSARQDSHVHLVQRRGRAGRQRRER